MENVLTFDIEADEMEMFLEDVNDLLQAMEDGILRLERAADPETLNSVFRAAHTLKAVAGTVGHHRMAELTHTVETLFDGMRESGLSPTQDVADELLVTVDALKTLRDEVVSGQPSGVDVEAILARLHALTEAPPQSPPVGGKGSGQVLAQRQLTPEQAAQAKTYHEQGQALLEVEVVASADSFAPAARLMQAAMAVAEAGPVIAQQPSLDDLVNDPHDVRLWLVLATEADSGAVEELLGDISELAEFQVQPTSLDALTAAPEPATAATLSGPSTALRQGPSTSSGRRSGQGSELGADKTVRISVERLDTLMNLVSELITDRTRLQQIEGSLRAQYGKDGALGALDEMAAHFSRVVNQLQDEVMRARMLPIAHLFDKFPRLVRDVARAAGKQVDLVMEGEATELDRSIIEVIGDPLVHLLRNAVDHGIESPQERKATGKPPTGTVRLTAAHMEGHIVITVEDDGKGIDPARVRRAAVRRGLFSEEEVAQLDDDEAIDLIFQPNLSTAEQVTEVSGRGVGMDVVRTNVERISGSVMVDSQMGAGTTFRLTLPLTLAIVQTMLVALQDDVYAIPLTSIMDTLYLADVTVNTVKGSPTIRWRDAVLPILNMRQFFTHLHLNAVPTNGARQAVVTVAWGKLRLGLVVDKIIGKQEIVVKSFNPIIGRVPGLSGCTILGDGCIALIIDIPSLINAAMQARRQEAV